MTRIGSTNQSSGALRASLAGFGALATGVALAVAVSSGPAAADSAATVATISVSASASTADVLPGEAITVTATVTASPGEPAGPVELTLDLPAGLALAGPAGPVAIDVAPGSSAVVSFDAVVDAALGADVTELEVGVTASTGASGSVTVTVLRQEASSVSDLGPAAASG